MSTVELVASALAVVTLVAALASWWSTRRALGLLGQAQDAADKAARSAGAARRRLDAATEGRLPLVATFERWGLSEQRADAFAREVQDRVRREVDGARAARGDGSRLEGHPVGSSAAFRSRPSEGERNRSR